MTNKYMKKILFFAVSISLLSCNPAEDGFNAPSGSTVTNVPDSYAFAVAATDTPGACHTTGLALATFQIHIPIGTQQPTIPEIDNANLQPGNNIQGVFTIGGNTTLYRFKDGVQTFLPENSLVDVVPTGTYAFVTDDRGLVHTAFTITYCYDVNGDLVASGGTVTANIGVSESSVPTTVSGG